jgi:hypothetical protein
MPQDDMSFPSADIYNIFHSILATAGKVSQDNSSTIYYSPERYMHQEMMVLKITARNTELLRTAMKYEHLTALITL